MVSKRLEGGSILASPSRRRMPFFFPAFPLLLSIPSLFLPQSASFPCAQDFCSFSPREGWRTEVVHLFIALCREHEFVRLLNISIDGEYLGSFEIKLKWLTSKNKKETPPHLSLTMRYFAMAWGLMVFIRPSWNMSSKKIVSLSKAKNKT